ncbi:MAG TPA: glycosyltransferase family 2 protein [Anaerolineaceae bacterium]
MEKDTCLPCDLGIVIVNYNTSALLRDCLDSVFAAQSGLRMAVCVVDNASADDSVAMSCQEFPQVHVIANHQNVGYPRANNQGLRWLGFCEPGQGGHPGSRQGATPPRFALLLNPDTVLPPSALCEMLAFMEARSQAGVAGPKLVRLDGSLDRACRRSFPTPATSLYHLVRLDRLFPRSSRFGRYDLTYLDPDVLTQVDAVVGAFMLVRREAIAGAGLLDETFFMYGEDLDWSKRIKDCGWQVWYNPAVTVLHIKEAASRHSYRARREFYRALILFYEKHYRSTTPLWLDWSIRGGVAFFGGLDLLSRRLRARLMRAQEAPGARVAGGIAGLLIMVSAAAALLGSGVLRCLHGG